MNLSFIKKAMDYWQFTLVIYLLLFILGLISLFTISRTEDPTLDPPTFVINVVLPSATPSEIEQLITKPVEKALYKLDRIREVRSQSKKNVSSTRIEFIWGTDPDASYEEINREINSIRANLPKDIQRLEVIKARPLGVAFSQLALTSVNLPYRKLEKIAEDLTDKLGAIPGISEAKYWGEVKSEMRISLNSDVMAALNISAKDVVQAIQLGGQESPIGNIVNGGKQFEILYKGAYKEKSRLEQLPVRTSANQIVRLADIANINWAEEEPQYITRFNGFRAVLVTVSQSKDEDVTKLTKAVDKVIGEFNTRLPGDVKLSQGFKQSENVDARLSLLKRDFLIALALVCITLLPLGLRASAVVMIAIPLSLLIGLFLLQKLGFTLNQLAIAGFVVALGLLVDDAIVVVENIARWLRAGYSRYDAALKGTRQISLAVLGCTACLMFSFIPLLALPEGPGEFIRSLPVAVLTTVAASLVISLTLIPLIASVVLNNKVNPEGNALLRKVNAGIHHFYSPALKFSLNNPKKTLTVLLLLTLFTFPIIKIIGTSLFPPAETPQFLIRVETAQGSSLKNTDEITKKAENILRNYKEIKWFTSNVGRGNPQIYYNIGQKEADLSFAELAVSFHKWETKESNDLLKKISSDLSEIPGAKFTFIKFVNGPEIEAPVVVRIVGPEISTLEILARRAENIMLEMTALNGIKNPLSQRSNFLRVEVNETEAAALGIGEGTIREYLQLALNGVRAANFRDEEDDQYPVNVRFPFTGSHDYSVFKQIYVPNNSNEFVKLNAISKLNLDSEPSRIDRIQRSRAVTLTAYVDNEVLVSRATEDLIGAFNKGLELPPGYYMQLGGEAETQARSFAGFLPAIVISSLGILAVLVLEFRKLKTVLVVFGIVPFGVLGAVIALWITGQSLSFTASVGLIALIGIEIKNSILLVDFTEQLREEGLSIRAAIEKAGEMRFLPVLLTSVTAIAGLLPLAIENNGLLSPTAITLIGGLIASTFLARIATPVTYLLLSKE